MSDYEKYCEDYTTAMYEYDEWAHDWWYEEATSEDYSDYEREQFED